jgi:hypothetical protein
MDIFKCILASPTWLPNEHLVVLGAPQQDVAQPPHLTIPAKKMRTQLVRLRNTV